VKDKLIIGVDLRPLVLGAGGGISQQTKGICEHMFALYPEHQFFVFCTPFNRSLLDFEANHVRFFSLPISNYFQEMDQLIRENDIEVLFRTYPLEDTLQFPLHKQLFLIPDIQHETYPTFFSPEALRSRRAAFSKALGGAGAIGTISFFSRKTLREFPETRCADVFLMPPSLQIAHKTEKGERKLSDAEYALIPPNDFFLFPANLWKHKNHHRLLRAFQLFLEKSGIENISLVLTGHPNGWPELQREFNDLPVAHLGFVRPELLRELYERARALVFFSLYEGFGMPLLEAFDASTPVLCSNTTSLPEVGGDAVLTCDPTNKFEIAALMERIQADENIRNKLIKRGRKRLLAYTWEDSAHSLFSACERVKQRAAQLPITKLKLKEPLPLVSIVTPSYNQGRFINRTIESVLSQRYPNIEYVVIDGGSNDDTLAILQSYGNRIDWVSEPDRGQSDAINKGMARVHGEIQAYLNSDDVLMPNAIERVVSFFKHNPDCDMIYGEADYIDENDRFIGRYSTADYSFSRLRQDCMVCQPAAFWRQRIANKIGPFDEKLNYAMDYDYWLRIAKAGGNISFLPEKLANSRLYEETKTRSARTAIYKEIFHICKKHTGSVHLNYYQGYWHHLIYEKESIISRALRRFPHTYAKFGWLHQKWDQRDRYTLRHIADFLIHRIQRRFARVSFFRHAIEMLDKVLAKMGLPISAQKKKVQGYEADNWLGPTVTIAPSDRVCGHILHIAGEAPIDLIMTITAGDQVICSCEFKKHQSKKVKFPAEAVGRQPIIIHFSSFITDNHNRRVSLLLHDTNIFVEADAF
jgi:glycosyltransferase involved in cell wall biosynthesis